MLFQIFTIIAPVIFIAALGYAWEKRGMPFDTNVISYLCSYIGAPCLMLNTLLQNKIDLLVAARVVQYLVRIALLKQTTRQRCTPGLYRTTLMARS